MMSAERQSWQTSGMSASTATRAAAGAAALTPTQGGLLDPTTNPRLPYNLDSWDGYPAQREAIFQTVKTQNKRLVALSGDSRGSPT